MAASISQLLEKKMITTVKNIQHLRSFRLSTSEITLKDNLDLQVAEVVVDNTKQCQKKKTDFIRNSLMTT